MPPDRGIGQRNRKGRGFATLPALRVGPEASEARWASSALRTNSDSFCRLGKRHHPKKNPAVRCKGRRTSPYEPLPNRSHLKVLSPSPRAASSPWTGALKGPVTYAWDTSLHLARP